MRYLSLSLPDARGAIQPIIAPSGIPTGGIDTSGTDIIQLIINLLFLFGIILAIASVIYGGIQMIMSEGDKQKVQNARNRLIYSIVGFVVILLAFLLRNLIVKFVVTPENQNLFMNIP